MRKITILQLVSVAGMFEPYLVGEYLTSVVIFFQTVDLKLFYKTMSTVYQRESIGPTNNVDDDKLPSKAFSRLRFPLILCAFEEILNGISVRLEPTNTIFECKLSVTIDKLHSKTVFVWLNEPRWSTLEIQKGNHQVSISSQSNV